MVNFYAESFTWSFLRGKNWLLIPKTLLLQGKIVSGTVMQQTFEINTGQLNQIYDAVIAKFGHRKVKVMIEDVQVEKPVDQKELAKNVLALRERFKHVKVDHNVDLSALANEMLGE